MFDSVPMIHWSPRQDSMSFLRILSFALDLHNIGGLSSNFRGVCPLYEQRDVVTFDISGENIRGPALIIPFSFQNPIRTFVFKNHAAALPLRTHSMTLQQQLSSICRIYPDTLLLQQQQNRHHHGGNLPRGQH